MFIRFAAIASLLLLAWSFLCYAEISSITKPRVKIEQVEYQSYLIPIRTSGTLESKVQQKLAFKIQGIIAEILVEEGQSVKKGQLLAKLDQAEILATVEQAKSVHQNALNHLVRFSELFEQNLVSSELLQSAETQLEVAKSNLEIAQFNLKHSVIRASGNGKVFQRLAERGELVPPNQTIFVLSDSDYGWVLKLGISDKDILKIAPNNLAKVSFDAYPKQTFQANVSEIAAAANSRTRLFEVELQLQPTTQTLYSGFIGRAEIEPNKESNLVMLPIESLVSAKGKSGQVFVLDQQNVAEPRKVEIAFLRSNLAAISSGISNGDRVITQGAAYVQPGLTVRL